MPPYCEICQQHWTDTNKHSDCKERINPKLLDGYFRGIDTFLAEHEANNGRRNLSLIRKHIRVLEAEITALKNIQELPNG